MLEEWHKVTHLNCFSYRFNDIGNILLAMYLIDIYNIYIKSISNVKKNVLKIAIRNL